MSTPRTEVGRVRLAGAELVVALAEPAVVVTGLVELRLTRPQALRLADLLDTAAMWQRP